MTTSGRRRCHTCPLPAPIVPIASPPVAGEGHWSPVGRLVKGVPAVYETSLRPSAIHTSYVVGVAWMDPTLLKATLYSGSQIPGGGPYTHTAPISPPAAASTVVAAFNAGFLMSDANGGYYTDNKTIVPLRTGAASFVVYKNGSSTVGQWGRDVSMGPDCRSVRQNLDLLVDNGRVAPDGYSAQPDASGARRSAAASTSGARGSASPPTARSSTWADRASTSPTWPTSWCGRVPCGPWSSTSTPTGSTSARTDRLDPARRRRQRPTERSYCRA